MSDNESGCSDDSRGLDHGGRGVVAAGDVSRDAGSDAAHGADAECSVLGGAGPAGCGEPASGTDGDGDGARDSGDVTVDASATVAALLDKVAQLEALLAAASTPAPKKKAAKKKAAKKRGAAKK